MTNKILIVLIVILTSNIGFSQNIDISVKAGKFIIDDQLSMIICNNRLSKISELVGVDTLSINLNGKKYGFNSIPSELEYGIQYTVKNGAQEYRLYFSELPIININTLEEIVDEPKVLSTLLLSDTTDSEPIFTNCGIEIRGGHSQSAPKKSYDLELWEGKDGEDTDNFSLLEMRNDDDWLLFAMYNEPLRIRNVISHELWRDIHAPYYQNEEEDAMSGITTEYIELAINNEYLGLYALTEQLDRKQLKLKKYKESLRGELYKGYTWDGAETFSSLPALNNDKLEWSGFELKYPNDDDPIDWTNLYDLVHFVINSSKSDFENEISEKFRIDNAVDYFIFMNLLRASDNRGKNIYIAKYDADEPYFYAPWDLDGVVGMVWDGTRDNNSSVILSNGLYDRLLSSDLSIFNKETSSRWFEMRNDLLEENNLLNRINVTYGFLIENGNYEREALKWGNNSIDLSNLEFTHEWLKNRLEFLDEYFSTTILETREALNEIEPYQIYPNPVVSTFKIRTLGSSTYNYSIYNLNGSLLKSGLSDNDLPIDIDYFSSGLYLLKLTDDLNSSTDMLMLFKR